MPAMAIEDIRRKLVTDTRPAVLARLREKAVQAGDDPDAVMAKFVTSDQTVAEGSREVVGAVSAETVDEDGDVILLKGWDLSYFRKHPVVMGFHDYGKYPTGKCLWIKPDKGTGRLLTKTQYATRPESWPREQEWPPDTILELRQQDVMRGYSVGFVLLEDREPTAKEIKAHPEWEGKRIIARAKLLEYSDVPLPCNADAAQIMVAKGLLPKQEADDDEPSGEADTADGTADGGELDGERGVPTDPDGAGAGDAGDGDPDPDGVADPGGEAEQVLGAAAHADPDGVEAKPSADSKGEAPEGSWEDTRYQLRSQLRDYLARHGIVLADDADAWLWIQYMADDYAIVQVEQGPGETETYYRIAWEQGADGPVFVGSPEPVELDVEIHPMGAAVASHSPAEVAHLRVLQRIADGEFVTLDMEKIKREALEKAVQEQLKYHQGHLG